MGLRSFVKLGSFRVVPLSVTLNLPNLGLMSANSVGTRMYGAEQIRKRFQKSADDAWLRVRRARGSNGKGIRRIATQ